MPVDQQVELLHSGSNYTDLAAWMKSHIVTDSPPNESRVATVAAADQFVLVDSTMQAGFIGVGTATQVDSATAWYFASALAGAVGTAATTADTDADGNYLNIVDVRVASTHQKILVNNFEVFGLLQAASTVTDGAAIGAAAAENLQISFAYVDAAGALTLTQLDGAAAVDIEFSMPVVRRRADVPTIQKENGVTDAPNVLGGAVEPTTNLKLYTVTANFAAAEVITLSTGAGAATGAATPAGTGYGSDTITTLGASATAFNENDALVIYRNGVVQTKGVDVIWDSATTFHFVAPLFAGEEFLIRQEIYAA